MKIIDLETEHLTLKRLSLNHLSTDYLSWLNNAQVNVYLETKGNYTLDMLKSYIEEQYKNEVYFWAIYLKKSNKHIGNNELPRSRASMYPCLVYSNNLN